MQQTTQGAVDIFQEFGNDIEVENGDLKIVTGTDWTNQRILRRLLTNIKDYIWHTDYGAGIPAFIGQPLSNQSFNNIKSLITSQIFKESRVARKPVPIIYLQTIPGGLSCQINYTDAPSQQPVVLTFNINV